MIREVFANRQDFSACLVAELPEGNAGDFQMRNIEPAAILFDQLRNGLEPWNSQDFAVAAGCSKAN